MQPHPGLDPCVGLSLIIRASSTPFLEKDVNCSDRTFGGHPSTLAVGNERVLAVCT